MAIPGSFNREWGLEVWKKILNSKGDKHRTSNDEPVVGPIADSDVVPTNPLIVRPSRASTVWNIFSSIIRQVRTRAGTDPLTKTIAPLRAPHSLDAHLDSTSDDEQVDEVVHELSARICHLLETCRNRGLFTSDELWRQPAGRGYSCSGKQDREKCC